MSFNHEVIKLIIQSQKMFRVKSSEREVLLIVQVGQWE